MKTTIIASLFLGVLLSGCTHSQLRSGSYTTDSTVTRAARTSASDQSPSYITATSPLTSATAPASNYAIAETNPRRVEAIAGEEPTAGPSAATASVPASFAYSNNATVSAERLRNWKLTAEDVSKELQTAGQIARTRTINAGEAINPPVARVNELIANKLDNNPDTRGLPLQVTVADGTAHLTGTAQSSDQIGKAVAIVLDTPGVLKVVSTIRTDPTRTP